MNGWSLHLYIISTSNNNSITNLKCCTQNKFAKEASMQCKTSHKSQLNELNVRFYYYYPNFYFFLSRQTKVQVNILSLLWLIFTLCFLQFFIYDSKLPPLSSVLTILSILVQTKLKCQRGSHQTR